MVKTVHFLIGVVILRFNGAAATSQHMICKTVGDLFEDVSSVETAERFRSQQGPPGKRGPQGFKGDRGAAGPNGISGLPGQVNYTHIEMSVQEKVSQAISDLTDRINQLENNVNNEISARIFEIGCHQEKGFVYHGQCYFGVVDNSLSTNLVQAKAECIARSANLADIFGLEQQTLAEKHLVKITPDSLDSVFVWTASTYLGSRIMLSNGSMVGTGSYRWFPHYPQGDHKATGIEGRKESENQGFFNYNAEADTHGAFCVKIWDH